jgi:ribonuclease J
LDEAEAHIEKALVKALDDGINDVDGLERIVRKAAGKFVSDRTKRRPMIVPVVMTT